MKRSNCRVAIAGGDLPVPTSPSNTKKNDATAAAHINVSFQKPATYVRATPTTPSSHVTPKRIAKISRLIVRRRRRLASLPRLPQD
ncbi:hypothetical protein XA68_18272 [Ophiocordyceps unilateralis]|uniref:Uncharacterized protein n=1 Tax=Ophiocordyceps unilateralis TaxID=268505 RepID=A0A2A9P398_OPHUN|nr:hypothetical protein XA68_18272 [Ophiocordyceps unilateralis]